MSKKSSKSSKKINISPGNISSGAQKPGDFTGKSEDVKEGPVYGFSFRYTPSDQEGNTDNYTVISDKMREYFVRHGYNYNYQLERGEDTKKYHFQCFLHHSRKKTRPSTLANQFREEIKDEKASINCSHAHSVSKLSIYCQKFQTSILGPWTDSKEIKSTNWDIKCIVDSPHPWQKTIIDEVKEPCRDDRTINWLYDPDGNLGKSKLVKYLAIHHGVVPLSFGKAADLLMLYLDNSNRNAYFFDLTRCKPVDLGKGDLYAAMEQIKNGLVSNGKFKGGIAYQDPPHIWTFSNMLPDVKCLSTDRWKIWEVDKTTKKLKKYKKIQKIEKIINFEN